MSRAIEHLKQSALEAERITIEQCIPVELVVTSDGVLIRVGGSSHEVQQVVAFALLEVPKLNSVILAINDALRRFPA